MTDRTRYIVAAAFFVVAVVLWAALIAQLPGNSFFTTVLAWFLLYPCARLTWLRGLAEWRYWAAGGGVAVGTPFVGAILNRYFGPGPSAARLWITLVIMASVIVGLTTRYLRKRTVSGAG